jgi:hypothetical protein
MYSYKYNDRGGAEAQSQALTMMKKYLVLLLHCLLTASLCAQQKSPAPARITLSRELLKDKIKGGWAGQTIGVTFGGPYEFRFQGSFIQPEQNLHWKPGYVKESMINIPGLYDDLYMDLSFVEVIDRLGQDAPVDSFANAFAHAGYDLWHANQAARYNILNGIQAPASGHWLNNPHADCIDYQIEADYAGLMSPGMPNAASEISDKIGHIMNYGDGWYGGIYVGAMYALAFVQTDIGSVVKQGLKAVPEKSTFHQCISDVIRWHDQYPNDWRQAWFEVQKKWAFDNGCPDGIYSPFNIDAKVNAAYVVIGLLYGKGDYGKTLDITTRCGQDADCNPSTAGGILGALIGFEKIPPYWKSGLDGSEDIPFKYTSTSLNRVYEMGYRHALENIRRHGGAVDANGATFILQEIKPVRLEQSFPGIMPKDKIAFNHDDMKEEQFAFEGTGFVVRGEATATEGTQKGKAALLEVRVDGQLTETVRLPVDFTTRRHELCWNYQLPAGKHLVTLKRVDSETGIRIRTTDQITLDKP